MVLESTYLSVRKGLSTAALIKGSDSSNTTLRTTSKNTYDGRFPRGSEMSVLTLQIYLNDVEKGGSTRFFDPRLKN
jgi:hypothetical protein